MQPVPVLCKVLRKNREQRHSANKVGFDFRRASTAESLAF